MALKRFKDIEYKDSGIDYSEQMGIAESNGDFKYAKEMEKKHNAKVLGEGLDYDLSYKYTKPEDYSVGSTSKPSSKVSSAYSSKSDAINMMMENLNRQQFSYDPNKDPLYNNYKKQAEMSAKSVSEDVLAEYAGMTGGMPSSYAVSAASKAAGDRMAQADNMIPELYKLALDKYNAERSDKYAQLGLMMDMDNTAYNRERDALEDERYERNWNHMLEREGIDDTRYEDEWNHMLEREGIDDTRHDEEWNHMLEREAVEDSQFYQSVNSKNTSEDDELVDVVDLGDFRTRFANNRDKILNENQVSYLGGYWSAGGRDWGADYGVDTINALLNEFRNYAVVDVEDVKEWLVKNSAKNKTDKREVAAVSRALGIGTAWLDDYENADPSDGTKGIQRIS